MTRAYTSICAFCGYEHDRTSQVEVAEKGFTGPEAIMGPGDATMCIECGEMNVVGDDDMLRKPTPEESDTFIDDPRIQFLRQTWRDVKATRQ